MKRISLYAALVFVILLLGVFALGYMLESTTFDHTLTIQAPIEKAFKNIASHELKPQIYRDITADGTTIEDYKEGNISRVCYGSENLKCFTEEILKVDSLNELSIKTVESRFVTTTNIYFTPAYLRTKLHIIEEIKGITAFDRAMLYFMKNPVLKHRKTYYRLIKSAVESTPDYDINPEELK
jgi:hypothetical protein